MNEPISRFDGRGKSYACARPIYPPKSLQQILEITSLRSDATVYDLGAGTGLFSKLLATHFDHINLVEPNADMAAESQKHFESQRFSLHKAPAESFHAPAHSIDLITAAQAFHWFDQDVARKHWKSVLKPTGFVALVWNTRTTDTPLAQELNNLLEHLAQRDPNCTPPQEGSDESVLAFFNSAKVMTAAHSTTLNQKELENLVFSRSYGPHTGDPDFQETATSIDQLFNAHQINGVVRIPYLTKVFIGQL